MLKRLRIDFVHPQSSALKIYKANKNDQTSLDIFIGFVYLFVIPEGFEPSTYALEVRCSIQLSYGTNK